MTFYTIEWHFSVNPELVTKLQRIYSYPHDLEVLSSTREAFKYDNVN